jgi:hypothetical protein
MTVGVAYFGNRILRHAAADMADAAERGFTGVLHTFSEHDLAHYRQQMARIIAASHDVGLQVQLSPWGLGHVFGGEADSRWVADNPRQCQVLGGTTPVSAACPSNPGFRDFVRAWADAAVDAGADRIFWDEPAWARPETVGLPAHAAACGCASCRAAFAHRFAASMPARLTDEVAAFRRTVLTEFIQELVAHVAARGVASTVCLLPPVGDDGADDTPGVGDWAAIAATPGVDALATAPYWKVFDQPPAQFVGAAAARVRDAAHAHGARAQLWQQGFGFGPDELPDFRTAVRAGRDAGVDELWVWGYEAGGHMSSLGTREPEVVWEAVCDAVTG